MIHSFGKTDCSECGKTFKKSSAWQRFCCEQCRNRYHSRLKRREAKERRDKLNLKKYRRIARVVNTKCGCCEDICDNSCELYSIKKIVKEKG